MQAVVLAAGRGARLGHLTIHRSKAMLPVAGKPLVGRVLERLRVAGLQRFVVVGGPDDEELTQYCRDGQSGFLSYVVQTERRGMAHALACAAPLIDQPFVLAACDNLVTSDFVAKMMAYLEATGADGVLALLRMSPERLQHSAAVELTTDGRVQHIVEKPPPGSTKSDAGSIALYAFSPRLLEYLDVPLSSRGEQELQSAVQALIEAGGDVRGLFAPGRRTVTRPADLLALNLHYLAHNGHGPCTSAGIAGGEPALSCVEPVQVSLPPDVTLLPPVRIETGVQIGAGCVIGPRVYLEAGCQVGEGAVLRDVVVLRGGVVPDRAEVVEAVCAEDA